MANIAFSSAGGEVISLAGGGGTDDAILTNPGYISSLDTITGATGANNKLIYDGAANFTVALDNTYSGFAGLESLYLTSNYTMGISVTDDFIGLNNSGGRLVINASSAATLNLSASGLSIYGVDVIGSSGADALNGGNGSDIFQISGGLDTIQAGGGNDTIKIMAASDLGGDGLYGGAGTDVIQYFGTGIVDLNTGALNSFENFVSVNDGVTVKVNTVALSTLTNFSMVAGGANDQVKLVGGGTANLTTLSLSGVDAIINDNVALLVTLPGVGGRYIGGNAADVVTGSAVADTIQPGIGADIVTAGAGDDVVSYTSQAELAGDAINGGIGGQDMLRFLNAGSYDLTTASYTGVEIVDLVGNGSTVTLNNAALTGVTGIHAVAGGAVDRVSLIGGGSFAMGSLSTTGIDVIANGDNAVVTVTLPSTGNLQYQGGTGTDSVIGGIGQETIFGGNGNDTLDGQANNDVLVGGAGADQLLGDAGDDLIFGGTDTTAAGDTINAGLGNDTVDGGDGADIIMGGLGNDLLFAGSTGIGHADTVQGNEGNDTLVGNQFASSATDLLSGGIGDDVILGGLGSDTLNGNDGNDAITGGTGNDSIVAGLGNDVMWGDAGIDTFAFLPLDGIDTIADFQNGIDKINLVGRSFGNYTAFTLAVTQTTESNGLTLTFADGAKIQLYGVTSLAATDFLF